MDFCASEKVKEQDGIVNQRKSKRDFRSLGQYITTTKRTKLQTKGTVYYRIFDWREYSCNQLLALSLRSNDSEAFCRNAI